MLKKIISLALSLMLLVSCSKKEQDKMVVNDTDVAKIYRQIPVADFCQPINSFDFKLSPGGDYVAYSKFFNGRVNLFVINNTDTTTIQLTYNKNGDITEYQWVSNNLLAFTLDFNGDGYHELYMMQADRRGFKKMSDAEKNDYRLTDLKTHNDNELFVEVSDENLQIYTLYKMDVVKRKKKKIANNPGNILSYLADNSGAVCIATFYDHSGSGIMYRNNDSEQFKPVVNNSFSEVISPIFFADSNKLIVTSNKNRDKAAIYEFDLEKKSLGKLLFEDNDTDLYEVFKSNTNDNVTGVLVEKDSAKVVYLDKNAEFVQNEVNSMFPDNTVKISQLSEDDQSMILDVYNGSHPGKIYFYNRVNKKLNLLMNQATWLKDEELASVKSAVVNSTDGLKLFTYLTEPIKPNGAAVILIHGGPWTRDYQRYNSDAQFLANRGYFVVQVNYRGSLSYGKFFLEKGYKEWGRGMINDLADVAKWLKKEKNMDKIAVMGTSFGGYAALRSLELYPDLYKCAVTQSPIINMLDMRKQNFYGDNDPANSLIGHPQVDFDMLKDYSPYYNYQAIKSPVLLVYGEQDKQVNLKQVADMVLKLQQNNVITEYYKKNGDDHGLRNPQNLIDYYKLTEKFLKKHLLGEN